MKKNLLIFIFLAFASVTVIGQDLCSNNTVSISNCGGDACCWCYNMGGGDGDCGWLCFSPGSPIILNLADGPYELTNAADGVRFDISGRGAVQIAWTAAGTQQAFLVLDRNADGTINDGTELFGNFTAQPLSKNKNGFAALAVFDQPENGGNADGKIDANDAIFSRLRLWVDANHNGVSEPNELFTLEQLGVQSLSLDYKESRRTDRFGNRFRYRSNVRMEGGKERLYDVFLIILRPPQPTAPGEARTHIPGTVDGAETPEKIPTAVVHGIFLRIASCSDKDDELQQRRCRVVQREIGLMQDDAEQLQIALAGAKDEIQGFENQILFAPRSPESDSNAQGLIERREDFVKGEIAALRQKLTPAGQAKFDAYVESMKKRIKATPQPVNASVN
ncbi:MAG: DUF1552 domain-containing protein [Acidobacteriia bacterium]|nr:DUF1552 domain-containing protein [Terriglobia bacterium]